MISRTGLLRTASALLALAAWLMSPGSANAQLLNSGGDVYFVHGLPGTDIGNPQNTLPLDVNVLIGGTPTNFFANVKLGEVRGPIVLTEGVYQIQVSLANLVAPGTNAPFIEGTVSVLNGTSQSFVACLTPTGLPQGVLYSNDISRSALVNGRITARHTADAPPVDVVVRSTIGLSGVTITNLKNPEQSAPINIMTGPYIVDLKPAGGSTVLTSSSIVVSPLNSYIVYAIGSPENGTLRFVIQTIRLKVKLRP